MPARHNTKQSSGVISRKRARRGTSPRLAFTVVVLERVRINGDPIFSLHF